MKFNTLIFTLVVTASSLLLVFDYGELADSVDKDKAKDFVAVNKVKDALAY